MTAETPAAVEAAATRLMSALALHEDARGTVTDLLADLWDAARDSVLPATALDDLAGIREDAASAINDPARRLPALHRIRAAADRASDGINAAPGGRLKDLGAAIDRAHDLRAETGDDALRAEIQDWIDRANTAQAHGDPAAIERILKTPYVRGRSAS